MRVELRERERKRDRRERSESGYVQGLFLSKAVVGMQRWQQEHGQ